MSPTPLMALGKSFLKSGPERLMFFRVEEHLMNELVILDKESRTENFYIFMAFPEVIHFSVMGNFSYGKAGNSL